MLVSKWLYNERDARAAQQVDYILSAALYHYIIDFLVLASKYKANIIIIIIIVIFMLLLCLAV